MTFFAILKNTHKEITLFLKLIEYLTTNFYIFLMFIKKSLIENSLTNHIEKIKEFQNNSNCEEIF